MAGWIMGSGQLLKEPVRNFYRVGNASIHLSADKQRSPYGFWETVDISIADCVAGNGIGRGSAKFNLTIREQMYSPTNWELTSNFSGNLMSKSTYCTQVPPRDHQFHFYGSPDKLRGCFVLSMTEKELIPNGLVQLYFGLDGKTVHAITLKILRNPNGVFMNIDAPTIQSRAELQTIAAVINHIGSKDDDEKDDDEGTTSKKESAPALEAMGLAAVKTTGSSVEGLGNGSIYNIHKYIVGDAKDKEN